MAVHAAPGSAQWLRGRVVSEESRSALENAVVSLLSSDSTALARASSGADGFFTLSIPGPGSYQLLVELMGYAPQTRSITIQATDTVTLPAIVLEPGPIPLDPIEARAARDPAELAVGFARASHLVSGSRMALLERQGARIAAVLREVSAVRVRELIRPRRQICVTTRRAISSMTTGASGCAVVVIDGIPLGRDGPEFLYTLHVSDVESIQFLPPVEAGFRYGMEASANGALEIWTRGRGPHKSDKRNGGD
jgi:hypothetical protein